MQEPEQEREYIVQLTYLPLRSFWSILKFMRLTLAVKRQLDSDSPGLIGYSFKAKILSHEFWTLSVWETDKLLSEFVVKIPHLRVMRSLRLDMSKTRFVKWRTNAKDLPPSWDDALSRIQ